MNLDEKVIIEGFLVKRGIEETDARDLECGDLSPLLDIWDPHHLKISLKR